MQRTVLKLVQNNFDLVKRGTQIYCYAPENTKVVNGEEIEFQCVDGRTGAPVEGVKNLVATVVHSKEAPGQGMQIRFAGAKEL